MPKMYSRENLSFPLDSLNGTCRLCLSSGGTFYQLFCSKETDALAVSLPMKVSLCTALPVLKNDFLPQKICQKCFHYINEWYLFRKKCRQINYFLNQKLHLKSLEEEKLAVAISRSQLDIDNATSSTVSVDFNILKHSIMDKKESLETSMNSSKSQSPCKQQRYKCSFCPDSFLYLKDLKYHIDFIHNDSEFFIDAPKKNQILAEVDVKLGEINLKPRYEMQCCKRTFYSKLKFRHHFRKHHPGEKPFMCETCGKKDFMSEETLKRHKILHTGKFRCEICSKTFTCNAILTLHKRDKHENDKPFVCDVCGKRFVSELLMNYHKRFHTGEKKYVCEECGLAVVTSSSLAKHKRIHSKDKPHVCHICGKGFIVRGRLAEHLRTHTGEKPYVCQVCQKGFTIRDKLKKHLRIHSGEKHFSCEYCGNNYSTKYGLTVHLKSHSAKGSCSHLIADALTNENTF